jgi:hypothetical protein
MRDLTWHQIAAAALGLGAIYLGGAVLTGAAGAAALAAGGVLIGLPVSNAPLRKRARKAE